MSRRLGVVAALVLAVGWTYAGVRGHDFLRYDDDLYVSENPHLHAPLDLAAVKTAFGSLYETNWIPLTWLSLHLDAALFGFEPAAFLVHNVALHALGAILLFLAWLRLAGALWPAAFVAGVFALHPLHVESVAWISERKDVLAGVCFGLALWCYAGSARAARPRHLGASAAFAAGLLAKQSVMPLPFVLLLLDVWPLRRFAADAPARLTLGAALREKAPLFALAAAGAGVAVWAQSAGGAMEHGDALPLQVRLANAALALAAYCREAVWPAYLAVFHPHPLENVAYGRAALAALALLAVTLLAWRARRTRPWLGVGWLWFLLLLAPTLGLVQVGVQARADRYTYLALTGLAVALAFGAQAWAGAHSWRRRACAVGALALLAALAVAARRQVATWQDTETLFRHASVATSGNFIAEHTLGSELLRRGDAKGAEVHFAEAVRLRPQWPEAHLGLADAYAAEGRYDEAVLTYERGLRLGPRHARGHLRLARVLLATGRSAEALGRARYALALARPSERADAQVVLGAVQVELRDFARAEAAFAAALALRPDLAEARAGHGVALLGLGRLEDGYAELQQARAAGNENPGFLLALGDAARALGREDEARAHYAAAAEGARAGGDTRLASEAAGRLGE